MLVSVLKYKVFLLLHAFSFSQLFKMLLVFLINKLYFFRAALGLQKNQAESPEFPLTFSHHPSY